MKTQVLEGRRFLCRRGGLGAHGGGEGGGGGCAGCQVGRLTLLRVEERRGSETVARG